MKTKIVWALLLTTTIAACHNRKEDNSSNQTPKITVLDTDAGKYAIDEYVRSSQHRQEFSQQIEGIDVTNLSFPQKDEGRTQFLRVEILFAKSDKTQVFVGQPGEQIFSQRNDKGLPNSNLVVTSLCSDKTCQSLLITVSDKSVDLDPDSRGEVGRKLIQFDAAKKETSVSALDAKKSALSWNKVPSISEALDKRIVDAKNELEQAPNTFKKITGYVIFCASKVANCNGIILKLAKDPNITQISGRAIEEILLTDNLYLPNESPFTPWIAVPADFTVASLINEFSKIPKTDSIENKLRVNKVDSYEKSSKIAEKAWGNKIQVVPSSDLNLDQLVVGAGKLAIAAPIVAEQAKDSLAKVKESFQISLFIDNQFSTRPSPSILSPLGWINIDYAASSETIQDKVTASLNQLLQ